MITWPAHVTGHVPDWHFTITCHITFTLYVYNPTLSFSICKCHTTVFVLIKTWLLSQNDLRYSLILVFLIISNWFIQFKVEIWFKHEIAAYDSIREYLVYVLYLLSYSSLTPRALFGSLSILLFLLICHLTLISYKISPVYWILYRMKLMEDITATKNQLFYLFQWVKDNMTLTWTK